jgi:hypothetical protein
MDICYAIARHPSTRPDFILPDADGRPVSHVATEGFLLSYWFDTFSKRETVMNLARSATPRCRDS